MKKILLLNLFFFCVMIVCAQEFYPSMVILSPEKINADDILKEEIRLSEKKILRLNKERLKTERQFVSEMSNEPDNIRLMNKKANNFSKGLSFYKNIAYEASEYLQYRFLEKFPATLVYPVKETSRGALDELNKIGDDHNVQYVMNIAEVELLVSEEEKKYSKVRVQLYDRNSKTLLLDKIYSGSDKNPGSDFSCDPHSVQCTVNNAMIRAYIDIFAQLFRKR